MEVNLDQAEHFEALVLGSGPGAENDTEPEIVFTHLMEGIGLAWTRRAVECS